MATENEAKFRVTDKDIFERLLSLDTIAGYETSDRGIVNIEDNYFDTQYGMLLRGKVVFRLRIQDGEKFLTFKSGKESGASYFTRTEVENESSASVENIISGNWPDEPPVKAMVEHIGKQNLSLSMKSRNTRHKIDLVRNGITVYEIAMDDVVFTGPRGKANVLELEIEAKTDSHSDLCEVSEWIQKCYNLEPAGPSKYILGMTLVGNIK